MKVLFLTNNKITEPLVQWLGLYGEKVRVWSEKITMESLKDSLPDFIISYNYRYIIKEDVISAYKDRIINLHISFLPWNRGADPNIWSFLDDTPKGVTIHLLDTGIDTGDILLQEKIEFDPAIETLYTSYTRLHEMIQTLFKENWEAIKGGQIKPFRQVGKGSSHRISDMEEVESITGPIDYHLPVMDILNRYHNR
jgi:methionyl-tRNA formyltransferase